MDAKPAEYLAGLTRSEAINYIQRLPGLTTREFNDLMQAAEKKPERRIDYFDHSETITLRLRFLVRYLVENPNGASTAEMCKALKMNGSNFVYTLRKAERDGLVRVARTEKSRRKIYVATAKAKKEVEQ